MPRGICMSNQVVNNAKLIKQYGRSEQNTGAIEVQVALLTERIKYLTEHFKVHKKDLQSRYGLQQQVNKRRRLLQYLKNDDFKRYQTIINELNLRDSY